MLERLLSKLGLRHSRDSYREMFADSGSRVFRHALEQAKRSQQSYLSLGHILEALSTEDSALFDALMIRSGLEPDKAKRFIHESIESYPVGNWKGVRVPPEVLSLLKRAKELARGEGRKIEEADFFSVLSQGVIEFPRVIVWRAN